MYNVDINGDRKNRELLPWPDSFPQALKSSIKLAFWVWFCTTATLLVLVKLD